MKFMLKKKPLTKPTDFGWFCSLRLADHNDRIRSMIFSVKTSVKNHTLGHMAIVKASLLSRKHDVISRNMALICGALSIKIILQYKNHLLMYTTETHHNKIIISIEFNKILLRFFESHVVINNS